VRERNLRLKAIKKIIRNHRIDSQETLLTHLATDGYSVTQATLSRDLKLLKVGKVSDGKEGYYYTLPGDDERRETERSFIQDVIRGYVSIDFTGNLAVLRTLQGHAASVGFAMDNLNLKEILGTIAGEDTVLLIMRSGVTEEDMTLKLREKIPELEL